MPVIFVVDDNDEVCDVTELTPADMRDFLRKANASQAWIFQLLHFQRRRPFPWWLRALEALGRDIPQMPLLDCHSEFESRRKADWESCGSRPHDRPHRRGPCKAWHRYRRHRQPAHDE